MVRGVGDLGRGTALLTADGKYILVAAASAVRLYSSVTGELVLSLNGHKAAVTALSLDHASKEKVYSASQDGTVKHWNYASGQLLQSFTVGDPVHSMVIPAGGKFAYLQCDWVLEKAGKMLFLDLTEGRLASYSLRLYTPSEYAVSPSGRFVATFFKHTVFVYSTERPALPPLKLYHTRDITCVAIDPTEERIAAGDVSGRILIWNGFQDKVPKLQKATPAATAVAKTVPSAGAKADADSDSDFDSSNSENAQQAYKPGQSQQQSKVQQAGQTAEAKGEAEAAQTAVTPSASVQQSGSSMKAKFSRLQRSTASVALTTVHWHAHPVGTLCFSSDGTLLLSGGEEAVLVVWQLDSGHKTFLPRLGGGLTFITRSSVDAACYVISQADNTVRMVNTATMKVEMSLHGMRPPPRSVTSLESTSAAVLAPGGGELVLPTDNSMLQFWDVAREHHVDKLQVAPRNAVSLTQQDHTLQGGIYGIPLEPHVSHVAFSSDGLVMATVDVRPNAGSLGSYEQSLRFWDRSEGGVTMGSDQEQPIYTINTYLDDPHRGGAITSLAYHPSRNMAASTSSSGDVKIWVQQVAGKKGKAAHWRCQSVGTHLGGPMSAAAFSSDGDLLAAATGDTVTLWDPYTNAIISRLASPPANQGSPLSKLGFVPNSPYLVGYTTGSNPSLILWNLITESIWWSYQLAVSAIATDPNGSSIAVAVPPEESTAKVQEAEGTQRDKAAAEQTAGDRLSEVEVSASTAKILSQGAVTLAGSETEAASGSAVFIFSAATGQPQLSWSLGQSTAAALLFALPGTKLHASAAAVTPHGVSPLLIVLQDRQYTFARSASKLHDASLQTGTTKQEQEPGAFEAAFGKAAVQRQAQPKLKLGPLQSETQGRLQALFDAPSHVLPSLTVLAPMFFDSLINNSNKAM